MPAPIIIPLIITGILVGTIAASKGQMVKRKKLLTASLLSGILNTANEYLVILLTPARSAYQGQFTGQSTGQFTSTTQRAYRGGGGGNFQLMLIISSFIVGFLIPLAVIGIGMLYARRKAGKGKDEESGGDEIDALREENNDELFKENSKKESKEDSKKGLKQDSDEEF